jgi:predicted  nucleic acid-binding Zn-ribbon protein
LEDECKDLRHHVHEWKEKYEHVHHEIDDLKHHVHEWKEKYEHCHHELDECHGKIHHLEEECHHLKHAKKELCDVRKEVCALFEKMELELYLTKSVKHSVEVVKVEHHGSGGINLNVGGHGGLNVHLDV